MIRDKKTYWMGDRIHFDLEQWISEQLDEL